MHYHPLLIISTHKVYSIRELGALLKIADLDIPDTHPDAMLIGTDLSANSIGIEAIRELGEWSSKGRYQHQLKIAVILGAERLTVAAQNSLLKTLEEPAEHLLICLVTYSGQTLLPTVTSRLQTKYIQSEATTTNVDATKLAQKFIASDLDGRIKIAEQIDQDSTSQRATAIALLQAVLEIILHQPATAHTAKHTELLLQALRGIKQGTNIKLTLLNVAISMNSSNN